MRYETIKFKNFLGEGQEYLDNEDKFFKSQNFAPNKRKNKLGNLLENVNVLSFWPLTPDVPHSGSYNGYVYTLTGSRKLYKAANNSALALVLDVSALMDEDRGLIVFKDKIIILGYLGTTIVGYYSTDGGATFTQLQNIPNEYFYNYEIVGNSLYIQFAQTILKSDDGISFTTFFSLASGTINVYFNGELEYFNGMLHVLVYNSKTRKTYFGRIENNEIFQIAKIENLKSQIATKKNIYLSSLKITSTIDFITTAIMKYDGSEISEIFNFAGYATKPVELKFLGTHKDKTFFFAKFIGGADDQYWVYSIDENDNVILEYIFPDTAVTFFLQEMVKNEDVLHFIGYTVVAAVESLNQYNNYNQKYTASGHIETSIIDKGEIVPKQIILRHKPLPANTSVKIYQKFDHASSYTLILTSDTDGAVKKKYAFPAGTIADFAQFKIELITTDATKTPEDVELEFLYLPVGLANAK